MNLTQIIIQNISLSYNHFRNFLETLSSKIMDINHRKIWVSLTDFLEEEGKSDINLGP